MFVGRSFPLPGTVASFNRVEQKYEGGEEGLDIRVFDPTAALTWGHKALVNTPRFLGFPCTVELEPSPLPHSQQSPSGPHCPQKHQMVRMNWWSRKDKKKASPLLTLRRHCDECKKNVLGFEPLDIPSSPIFVCIEFYRCLHYNYDLCLSWCSTVEIPAEVLNSGAAAVSEVYSGRPTQKNGSSDHVPTLQAEEAGKGGTEKTLTRCGSGCQLYRDYLRCVGSSCRQFWRDVSSVFKTCWSPMSAYFREMWGCLGLVGSHFLVNFFGFECTCLKERSLLTLTLFFITFDILSDAGTAGVMLALGREGRDPTTRLHRLVIAGLTVLDLVNVWL
uniref:Uncharacterized protein n=1 Tax=Chromera velia CCMP2878 TaxID=1169474 RepID=A0A0G4GCL1_9ALVE|eukprot:Cvel_21266.t1-p1 / transcript=Cvel_21266.t1 / gene=Cvel_21266 / organism=Chromera_velia_CCMP2878 / gene_product=hypothetical protein / transcript_product=hypothetical protein / location=Cvel_scaffold1979:607-1599(+) / protein_length=331 / sequence_SO=supercontig / SO=protein_coding / is_pseudo=false